MHECVHMDDRTRVHACCVAARTCEQAGIVFCACTGAGSMKETQLKPDAKVGRAAHCHRVHVCQSGNVRVVADTNHSTSTIKSCM